MVVHSRHTFMFPFQWDYTWGKKTENCNARTRLEDFDRLFLNADNCFVKVPFNIGLSAEKYNEYTYFHAFARKALYYRNDNDSLRYYELEDENGSFNIDYLIKDGTVETIALTLESVCLHVFDIGVGVMSFNIVNTQYPDKETILIINDYGRRLYPQYMTTENRLAAKMSFLPERIHGRIGRIEFSEDFSAYENPVDVHKTFLPPEHIKKVFGYQQNDTPLDKHVKFVFSSQDKRKGTIRIRPVTDDRMFFLCYYENGKLADRLALKNEDEQYQYLTDEYWYAFVYGDKSVEDLTVGNKCFQREQIKKQTYTRWLKDKSKKDDSSIYGVTRDSFVCIGGWPLLGEHMKSMYYQMAVLSLVQRASLLRFSREIVQVTDIIFERNRSVVKPVKDLYENYLMFINRIYFREVTSQIQGIEIYSMFQSSMSIEKEVKDLDNEMQEINNYLSVQEQTKLAGIANRFLPATLIAGTLGINTFSKGILDSVEVFWTLDLSDLLTIIMVLWTLYILLRNTIRKI